jgi:hypothetical protein
MDNNKDASWYIKWIASIILLAGLSIRVLDYDGEYRIHDQILTLFGAIGWFIVGWLWRDRSIMVCNGMYSIVLTSFIIIALI